MRLATGSFALVCVALMSAACAIPVSQDISVKLPVPFGAVSPNCALEQTVTSGDGLTRATFTNTLTNHRCAVT